MAKGFKKDGKFIPTNKSNRKLSSKQITSESKDVPKHIEPLKEKNPIVSKKLKQMFKDSFGEDDIEAFDFNPKWKLTHLFGDEAEYFHFPDEESAIAFGRQSIKDTAGEYIPEEGSPEREEYLKLNDEEIVEKIIDELSDGGLKSELSAIAQTVAGADGQSHELEDGSIVFQIS